VQLHVLLQRHEFSTLTLLDLFTHPSPVALADYLTGVASVEKTKRVARFAVVSGGFDAKQTDFPGRHRQRMARH
jgi:hypothetical protein